MAIVSHSLRLIFLKTRKTAGSSIEAWLAPHLDAERDLAAVTADLKALDPALSARLQPRGLKAHGTALHVRDLVGEDVWTAYHKVAVERDPWDRIISLWRWRSHHRGATTSLDAFLDAIESGDPQAQRAAGAEDWSNWPIYAMGEQVVADVVVPYQDLTAGLREALTPVGLNFDGALPRLKSGLRRDADRPDALTPAQVARIARLFPREIETFGFRPPTPV